MSCRDRVVDVFVTKDDSNYKYDDTFAGPVWSIAVVGDTGIVVNKPTHWITLCNTGTSAKHIYDELEIGDLVRIGNVDAEGYTDYMTIMKKTTLNKLANGCIFPPTSNNGTISTDTKAKDFGYPVLQLKTDENPSASDGIALLAPQVGPVLADASSVGEKKITEDTRLLHAYHAAFAHTSVSVEAENSAGFEGTGSGSGNQNDISAPIYAYKLNFAIDATTPHVPYHYRVAANQSMVTLRNRHLLNIERPKTQLTKSEQMPFPLYKVNKWLTNTGEISVSLDHGVKSLSWIKLVGYSVFNKRQSGFQTQHEMIADDWVAVHIDEIEGGIVSNNKTANGAFCVLHVGGTSDNHTGAIEFHQHDTAGIATHYFDNHQSTIRNLHLKFLDREGNPAHFGRIHLWFKICVQHG